MPNYKIPKATLEGLHTKLATEYQKSLKLGEHEHYRQASQQLSQKY